MTEITVGIIIVFIAVLISHFGEKIFMKNDTINKMDGDLDNIRKGKCENIK